MRGCLRDIFDDDPPEVVVGPERISCEPEDLDELSEVAEPAQLEIGRQGVVVPPRDLPQRLYAQRSLEVHVQFGLRVWRHGPTMT